MTINFGAGMAEMKVDNLALGDYFTKPNAFGPNWATNFVPATASFDVVWSAPVTRRLEFQDATNVDQFSGTFVEDQASVTWSASNANGFSFTANPGDFSTSFSAFAELAHVQNGNFFDSSSTDSVKADAVLTHALAASPTAPAAPGATLLPPPRRGVALVTTLVGNAQSQASSPTQPAWGAAHPQVVDELFTDLGGNGLAGTP